jgi:hypothetical protein
MVNKDKIVCHLKQKDFSGIVYVPYDTVQAKK